MNLYEEVKEMFKISEKSKSMFFYLKSIQMSSYKSNNVLIIFKNQESLKKYNKELKKAKCEINSKTITKTITQCQNIDGYRFKKIIFYD